MPSFLDHILRMSYGAALSADWTGQKENPYHLGIRASEQIEYGEGGELLPHNDDGSVYTLILMLSSHPGDFTGGVFYITASNDTKMKYYKIDEEDSSGNISTLDSLPINKEETLTFLPSFLGGVLINSNFDHG